MALQEMVTGTSSHDKNVLESVGLKPVDEGGVLFCGVSQEEFAISGVTYQWPKGVELAWGINFSKLGQLSDMDCKDAITKALKEISSCCDIKHKYVANANAANLKMTVQRLDGSSGVLADFQIPVGNVSVDQTQLLGRFDDSEAWVISETPRSGEIDFYRVVLHELEHGHGLGHKPASIGGTALIAPIYSPQVGHLQPLDIQELVRRYGASKTPGPVTPSGDAPLIEVRVQSGGKWYTAKGVGKPE